MSSAGSVSSAATGDRPVAAGRRLVTGRPPGPPPKAEVIIDLAAIRHNVGLLSGRAAASGAATMAVVKADGYGHGGADVARAALDAGATWVGACTIDEALRLRADGIDAPMFAWLYAPDEDVTSAVAGAVDLSVSSRAQLDAVLAAARDLGRPARVHLKIDTGLTRGGAQPAVWPDLVAAARLAVAAGLIDVVAVWSHLACADEPGHPTIDAQAGRLDRAYRLARDAGLRPLRHLSNSAAALTRPDLRFDLIRAGIAVYGLSPVPELGSFGLRPAMTFRSRVVLVKRVPADEGVAYGHTYRTSAETTLALVPVGYADGVPRGLSGRMDVQLRGRRLPVAGRVSMDQIMVDCGDVPVAEGDEVLLFGPGDRGEPTAADWARQLGTISYEVVCGMVRSRVVRTVRGGR
jgi:alanine racemase